MFPENNSLTPPEEDPLENLLIEHPSMSVYQIRHQTSDEEDSDEEDASPRSVFIQGIHLLSQCDNTTIILEKGVSHFTVILSFPPRRPVPVKQHVSWRLAAWGSPLPCNVQLLAIQRARTHVECKKLTRSALQRQNLAKVRFSPSDRRFGHFKQPCQRLYNY